MWLCFRWSQWRLSGFGNSLFHSKHSTRRETPYQSLSCAAPSFPKDSVWIHASWTHRQSKPGSFDLPFWCKCRAHTQFTALGFEWRASFKFRALKEPDIRQHCSLYMQTALRQEQSPYTSMQPEGTLQWINEMKAWTAAELLKAWTGSWASLLIITEA